jgi:hypothetical protein
MKKIEVLGCSGNDQLFLPKLCKNVGIFYARNRLRVLPKRENESLTLIQEGIEVKSHDFHEASDVF